MTKEFGASFSIGDAIGGETSLNASWNEPILWVTRLGLKMRPKPSVGPIIHFQFVIPGKFVDAGFTGSRKARGRAHEDFAAVEIALPEGAPLQARAYLLARMIESTSLISTWATRTGHRVSLEDTVKFLREQLELLSPADDLHIPTSTKIGNDQPDLEGRVVVRFTNSTQQFPLDWVDALAPTETAASAAVERALLGSLEGSEIGDHEYQLSFVGTNGRAIWSEIKGIFDRAPVHWSQVRIEPGPSDQPDEVIEPS